MSKNVNIKILSSFVGLWLTSLLTGEIEVLLGFFLIFTFGILHGSNDILLIAKVKGEASKFSFPKILTVYIITVLLAVALFIYTPILGLILFIIFSAFHFGEQHWMNQNIEAADIIKKIYFFIYGGFILMLLFVFNKKEVIEIVKAIADYNLDETIITYTFSFVALCFALFTLILTAKSKIFKHNILLELFYLLLFCIIFKVSTLIWGFTIYFIFWHSLPSLNDQIHFIYGECNNKNIIRYCKNAVIYWAISLLGIATVYYVFNNENIFYAVFFSFIAAVTFPHSIVITKMFKQKKRNLTR